MEDFYGLEVAAGRAVRLSIPKDRVLHITQVALPPTVGAAPLTLRAKMEGKAFVLATLDPLHALFHMNVDMLFSGKQEVVFTCEGATGVMHLIGYTQLAEEAVEAEDEDDEEEGAL